MQEFYQNIVGNRLSIGIKGKIDDDFELNEDIYKLLEDNKNISELVFILRKVSSFSETGLKKWFSELKTLNDKSYKLTFLECPASLSKRINEASVTFNIKNIKSFAIPYYCEECNDDYYQIINTNSAAISFSAYASPLCSNCKKKLNLDITEDDIDQIISLSPSKESYSDKRKYPRFDISGQNIKVSIIYKEQENEALVINFSEAGLCLQSTSEIRPGEHIRIESNIKKKVLANGSVVWSSTEAKYYTYGISLHGSDIYKQLIKLI
jgi:hypothetical protein